MIASIMKDLFSFVLACQILKILLRSGSILSITTFRLLRIVRVSSPLLRFADRTLSALFYFFLGFSLIPFGIALFWYSSPNSSFSTEPIGAQNLLPCKIEILPGTNGFDVLRFVCSKEILITVANGKEVHPLDERATEIGGADRCDQPIVSRRFVLPLQPTPTG